MSISLSPAEYPVDRVITETSFVSGHHTPFRLNHMPDNPNLPIEEIQGLHNSGLSTDEDGETIVDTPDPVIPFGWSIIEGDYLEEFFFGKGD